MVEVDDRLMVGVDISLRERRQSILILHPFEVNEVRTFIH